jgi:hypothetical protein
VYSAGHRLDGDREKRELDVIASLSPGFLLPGMSKQFQTGRIDAAMENVGLTESKRISFGQTRRPKDFRAILTRTRFSQSL